MIEVYVNEFRIDEGAMKYITYKELMQIRKIAKAIKQRSEKDGRQNEKTYSNESN